MIKKYLIFLISMVCLFACEMRPKPVGDLSIISSLPFYFGDLLKTKGEDDCKFKSHTKWQNINWKEAKRIDIYSRKSGLTPKNLLMKINTPYIIKIFNGTNDIWTFHADIFFNHSAVLKVIYKGIEKNPECINSIRVGKLKWAEVHIIPLRKGVFSFQDRKSFNLKSIFFVEEPIDSGQIIVN